MRTVVAGGGVSGLAAAIALRRSGHEVIVVERAAALSEVGAGVVLGPHAMRVVEALGAAEHLRRINLPPERMKFHNIEDGSLRVANELGEVGRKLYGIETGMTHRRDLIDALAGQLGDVQVLLDSTIVGIAQDASGVTLQLADGRALESDLLVGADGLRSTVRTALFGESAATFTGFLAWRSVVPVEHYGREFAREARLWLGSGRHVVSYPIRRGRQIYASFYVPAEEIHREDWSMTGDLDELRRSFADACPEVRELVGGVTQAFITGIFYRPPIQTWHQGRVVLVGDAAHPVLPTSGTGAGMALEDSVCLAGCLARHGRDHEAAFAEFQARRWDRTTRVLYSSRIDLQSFHEIDAQRVAIRARMNRGVMRLDPTGYARMSWQYQHDEVKAAARSFAELQAAGPRAPLRPEAKRAFDFWRGLFTGDDQLHGWISERAAYRRAWSAQAPWPADTQVEAVECEGVRALKITPAGGAQGPAVLHLHGGGHLYGDAATSVAVAAAHARAVGGWALVPELGPVPEHTAQATLAQARAAWDWLQRHATQGFISGESSGGGIAVGLAQRLAVDATALQAAALYLHSPFVDATLTSPTIDAHERTEAWLSRWRLLAMAGAWTQGDDPAAPLYSPLHGDLSRLPPMRVFAAADETLAGDAQALVERARAAGVDARLTQVPDSVHGFARFECLPETAAAFAAIAADAAARLGRAASGERAA